MGIQITIPTNELPSTYLLLQPPFGVEVLKTAVFVCGRNPVKRNCDSLSYGFSFFHLHFPIFLLFFPPSLCLELLWLAPLSTFLPFHFFSHFLQPLNPVPALQTPKTLTPTQLLWVLRIYIYIWFFFFFFFFAPPSNCVHLSSIYFYGKFIYDSPFLPLMAFMTQLGTWQGNFEVETLMMIIYQRSSQYSLPCHGETYFHPV